MRLLLTSSIALLFLGCGKGVAELALSGVCDGYSDYATSSYVAPWEAGVARKVGQGNCGVASHFGSEKYAYDIVMPIGTNVIAARAGTVYKVVKDKSDGNGCSSGENHIFIIHSDGTMAKYLHLTNNGSLVAEGASVVQSQIIGLSGNTGCSSGPHLHFEVDSDSTGGPSIPITFKNIGSNRRGPQEGKSYTPQ